MPTAQQVVDRIKKNLGVPWKTPTVDGFIAGSPDTPVKGIATTFAPTLDMLRRSAAVGKNMIVSRESPYYNHAGPMKGPPQDPTCLLKQDFIVKNNLVVWRFSDHWDGQLRGLAKALGWDKFRKDDVFFVLPGATLGEMAKSIQDRLKIRGMRVIGDPRTKVSKAALTHGLIRVPALQAVLKEPGVDVVVIGEPVEWEASPYFEDVIASGQKKGMIILGQEASEEPGSGEVATWLRRLVPEVPIDWIPAGEPFWRLS